MYTSPLTGLTYGGKPESGQRLFFESEYPRAIAAKGSESPFFRGTFCEDSKPAKSKDVPTAPVVRPNW